jgi:outer membrane protein assembly factor BamB
MGVGSSPRIHGSLVLLNSETDGECRLYAIDKSTGRVRWSVPRRVRQAGYSSPVVVGDLVAVAGHGGIAAYRLADGSQAWSAQRLGDYLGDYVVATPVVAGALLVHPELAVDPAGRVAWSSPSGGGFPVASAVVSEGRAYTLGRNCVLSCVDVATGRRLGQRRIMDGRCFASPVLSGGLIHAVGMEGRSVSIRARPELDEAGSRELGGQAVGSPAVSGGMLLVRVGASLVAYRGQ